MTGANILTFDELKNMNGQTIKTIRGEINIAVESSKCQQLVHLISPLTSSRITYRSLTHLVSPLCTDDVYLEWEGIKARILRSDVNAVNGVIHLLDQVLMKKRDLASSAHATFYPSISVLFASLLTVLAYSGNL